MPSIISILIRLAAFIYQSLLLIRSFGLLAPLWSFILSIVFLFTTLLLGHMHCLRVVLARTVHGHEFQRLCPQSIDELMLGPRRYDNYIRGFDVLRSPADEFICKRRGHDYDDETR